MRPRGVTEETARQGAQLERVSKSGAPGASGQRVPLSGEYLGDLQIVQALQRHDVDSLTHLYKGAVVSRPLSSL